MLIEGSKRRRMSERYRARANGGLAIDATKRIVSVKVC